MDDVNTRRKQEAERLGKLIPSEIDFDAEERGVLLSDKIREYVHRDKLIDPFNEDRLKPAGYELTAGDEWYLLGDKHSKNNPSSPSVIKIPRFSVAVIKTSETICLPRFLIARWNIRVKLAYKGLLWVGGPQVDPGFVGHLFCPIYNMSDDQVVIELGEPIALIDFVKTTHFDHKDPSAERSFRYPHPPERVVIEDYPGRDLKSGLYSQVDARIERFSQDLEETRRHSFAVTTIVFAVLAVIVGALGALFQFGDLSRIAPSLWGSLLGFTSVFALIVSSFALLTASNREKLRKNGMIGIVAVLFAIFCAVIIDFSTTSRLGDLNSHIDAIISKREGKIRSRVEKSEVLLNDEMEKLKNRMRELEVRR